MIKSTMVLIIQVEVINLEVVLMHFILYYFLLQAFQVLSKVLKLMQVQQVVVMENYLFRLVI